MTRIIIDVREPYEYAQDHVDGALNIPPTELLAGAKQLQDVPKDTELILYCKTGSRSNVSMQLLGDMGITNLTNGINADQVRKRFVNNG